MENYDFSGWATRNDLECSDGRIIRRDAFKHCDGMSVPLVWNHDHTDPYRVVGHALLENRDEGVYTYGKFNNTDLGKTAKEYVQHGDITSLSIYANQLRQQGPNVLHGAIREVSLVLAGANPGAFIENVIKHGEASDEEAVIFTGEELALYHADEDKKEDEKVSEEKKNDRTIKDVYDEFTEEQKDVVAYLVGEALAGTSEKDEVEHSEGGSEEMKHNVFDKETETQGNALSHSDQQSIMSLAKQSNVGSFKMAMEIYQSENGELAHGFETAALEELLPEFKNLNPGAPSILRDDQSWVMRAINKIHKSPYSRIRTRQADARIADLKAKGYQKKGDQKRLANTIKLLSRTTDPQTIYIREDIHRDDIIDIEDFDYVSYVWSFMKDNMYETLALAALVGDNRDDGDADKIHETHVRSILHDDELYTIKATFSDADMATRNGTNTGANFGKYYLFSEVLVDKIMHARMKYKGTGTPDFYCAPGTINKMLLARDLNGRRIYESKADIAKALNVAEVFEVEQFEGYELTGEELIGIIVNLGDYQFGSAKGGEVTKFDDFDIDFNKHKYLMETRVSGALVKPFSAIAVTRTTEEAGE